MSWNRIPSTSSFASTGSSDIEGLHITPQTTIASDGCHKLYQTEYFLREPELPGPHVVLEGVVGNVNPLGENVRGVEVKPPASWDTSNPHWIDNACDSLLAVPSLAGSVTERRHEPLVLISVGVTAEPVEPIQMDELVELLLQPFSHLETSPYTYTYTSMSPAQRTLLAEGAGGWIYALKHRTDPSVAVVLKKLKVEFSFYTEPLSAQPQVLYDALAIREFRIMKKCNVNTNILSVSELLRETTTEEAEAEGSVLPYRWCLVLPLAARGCLKTLLSDVRARKLAFPVDMEDLMFKKLVKAVLFLHKNQLVHRDLKPENVLIDSQGELKLTDFGYALDLTEEWDPAIRFNPGTTSYKAPELARSTKPAALVYPPVDVWALGVSYLVIAFMLQPWGEANRSDTAYASYAALYRSENISQRYKQLVLANAFAKSPTFTSERPRVYEIFSRIKSLDAAEVVLRMLDPDPATRATIAEVSQSKWMRQCVEDNQRFYEWITAASKPV